MTIRRTAEGLSAPPDAQAPPTNALATAERSVAAAFLAAHPPGAGTPLAVVIAAYNEADIVGEVVRAVPREVDGLATEVIVVVDGAVDATAAEAVAAGALVCDVPVNQGQGAALRLGYLLARSRGARIVVTLDADGQFDPAELPVVVEPIVAGRSDFVSGSRRLGTELTVDTARHVGVIVFAALISVAIRHRVTDPACGLRAMRAEVTAAVTLEQAQYQSSELLISAALNGYRVSEVPITMRPRGAGRTKKGGNLAYGVRFGRVILRTWWRDRGLASGSTGRSPVTKITRS